ncbi:Ttll4 [Symbiodinium sp. CCMP2456]|nr:Ttll4 [Symbiodinium sp. CCMP2456]
MGDTQAVEVAQTWAVIDDHVCLSIERRSNYRRVNLIPHEGKAVRDSLQGEFWGLQVDGSSGLVRGSLKRAVPLLNVILDVLELGIVTVNLLEIIAGGLIALFMYRRRLMCLMQTIFSEMTQRSENTVLALGSDLREELILCCLLVTTAVIDLKAHYNPTIFACDASGWGEAVVSLHTSEPFAKEMYRHCLRKSVWTRLLSPAKARLRLHGVLPEEELELPGGGNAQYRAHAAWIRFLKSGKFKLRWKRKAKSRRHINIGEVRAFLRSERCAKLSKRATRCLVAGDSQVAIGCLLKGRSSSIALNKEIERALPHTIGGGIYSGLAYSPTSINPSDAPTRGRDVGEPTEDLPNWYEPLLSKIIEPLDAFLQDHGCSPYALTGVPSLNELVHPGREEVVERMGVQRNVRAKSLKQLLSKVPPQVVSERLREAAEHCPKRSGFEARQGDVFPGPCRDLAHGIGTIVWPDGVERSECQKNRGYLDLFSGSLGVARQLARISGRSIGGLRSIAYPQGKPGIPEKAQIKVAQGNQLVGEYNWACRIQNSVPRLAEAYPKGVSLCIAMSLAAAAGDRPDFINLDIDGCAKASCKRIGEASNPGPAVGNAKSRAARRRGITLQEAPLVEPKTQDLEVRLWGGFLEWVRDNCSSTGAEELLQSSVTTSALLKEYGEHLFESGATLSAFRHLITFAQRTYSDFKQHAKVCCDMVTRWEQLEPLVHRPPLPHKLCEAMVAIALSWNWPRFGLLLLIAFFGIMRIGEVLQLSRAELVLPSDLLSDKTDQLFVKVTGGSEFVFWTQGIVSMVQPSNRRMVVDVPLCKKHMVALVDMVATAHSCRNLKREVVVRRELADVSIRRRAWCKGGCRDRKRILNETDKAALSLSRLPEMHFCLQTTRDVHEYNAVVNTFKMAGWTRVPVGSSKFAIYWGPHPTPEMLRSFNPFQRANHFPNSWQLGRKDLLGKNIHRMKRQFPKDYNIMPLSFSLPEDSQAWSQARDQNPEALWIWKPANLSCGKGIRLLASSISPGAEKKILQRSGVVQRYVDGPLLVNGFKFDLRLYVVVTSFDPLKVYINEEGLVRLATQKYRCSADSLQERTMHLTNYSVNKHAASYKQNLDGQDAEDADGTSGEGGEAEEEAQAKLRLYPPSRVPSSTRQESTGSSKWSLRQLEEYFKTQGLVPSLDYGLAMSRIEDVIIKTLIAVEPQIVNTWHQGANFSVASSGPIQQVGPHQTCFEIYGFDILLDTELQPWLLEVNVFPSFSSSSPYDKRIKTQLVADVFTLLGIPPYSHDAVENACKEEQAKRLQGQSKSLSITRSHTVSTIKSASLKSLGEAERRLILESHEENMRSGHLTRIYPRQASGAYSQFFASQRYTNLVLERWIQLGGERLGWRFEQSLDCCYREVRCFIWAQRVPIREAEKRHVMCEIPSSADTMTAAEAKFYKDGYTHRTVLYDNMQDAKAEYGGALNFSAYRQGRDRQYLGVNGKNYYAKPWGNDSSNIQAVINGPSYWKRVYYRENIAARFAREDAEAAERKAQAEIAEALSNGAGEAPPRRSQSESALQKPKTLDAKDTYAPIKENMKPFVEKQGKPRIRAMEAGERLHFFNTLHNKYHMKAGGKNLEWNVSKQTHRSTKNELNWILSNYFRTDSHAVLKGAGQD